MSTDIETQLIISLILFGIGLFCFFHTCHLRRNKRLMDDVPTSKTNGVFIGMVELKGVAVSRKVRYSPYTRQEFVFCLITISEEWQRWETETYYDSSEQRYETRQVLHSGWTQLEGVRTKAPFYLQDNTGAIRVWPEGAEMDITQSWEQTVSSTSPYYNRIARPEISDSTHRRKITETIIKPGEALYLFGSSRLREDIVAPEIAQDDCSRFYTISTKTEEELSSSHGISLWAFHFLALCFWGATGFCLFPAEGAQGLIPVACCAAVYLPLAFSAWIYQTYASLILLRNLALQGESNIDVQLKRRNDLIPALVTIVKQYCRHEKEIQRRLILLKRQIINRQEFAAGNSKSAKIGVCAPLLTALAESYPELQASELFRNLKKQIVDTEQKIMLARKYYNDIVLSFNTRIQSFPTDITARLCRMKPFSPIKLASSKNKAGKG